MRASIRIGIITLLLAQTQAYALDPFPGCYGGIMLGATYKANNTFYLADPTSPSLTKQKFVLTYGVLGDFSIYFGYRFNQLRAEGQFMYNNNPYKQLRAPTFRIDSPKSNKTGYRMKGDLNVGALMANGFYDFFCSGGSCNWVPYLGAGVGYAYVSNGVKFYYQDTYVNNSRYTANTSTPAAQGIIGMSYFVDDYTSFSLDYRYFTTKSVQPFNSRIQLNIINFGFTGHWGA